MFHVTVTFSSELISSVFYSAVVLVQFQPQEVQLHLGLEASRIGTHISYTIF